MPSSPGSRKSPKPSRNYHLPDRPEPEPPFGANMVMALAWVAVSIWSCFDGRRTGAMMLVATVGTVALVQVLSLLFSRLRQTRLVQALFSGTLVFFFMPVWDWLSLRFLYPESLWTALGFGTVFGLIRYIFGRRPPARPPS